MSIYQHLEHKIRDFLRFFRKIISIFCNLFTYTVNVYSQKQKKSKNFYFFPFLIFLAQQRDFLKAFPDYGKNIFNVFCLKRHKCLTK